MNKSFILLLVTTFLSTVSAGLFWTGFPVFLNEFGQGDLNLSKIYAYATFGSLLFSLVGGILSDIANSKKLSIISQFFSAFILIAVYFKFNVLGVTAIVYVLPIIYFNFAIANISELVWLLRFENNSALKIRILDRALLSFLAKMIGFSFGPVLFSGLGTQSLMICGGLFFLVAIVQIFLPHPNVNIQAKSSLSSIFSTILELCKKPVFVGAVFLTGMLSIPLNPLFVTQILQLSDAQSVSAFWVLAGFAGLINIFLQRLGWIELSAGKLWISTIALMLAVGISLTTSSLGALLFLSTLYVFGSVFFSMHLHISLGVTAVKNKLGSSFGLLNLLIDAGIFFGMTLGSFAQSVNSGFVVLLLSLLLFLRAFFVSRLAE